jgi:hypothetical protein
VSCKEAADCASGSVCCEILAYPTPPASTNPTSCQTGTCPTGDFQLCRTDAECGSADAGPDSQKCIVQTCYTSAAMTTPVTVEACAYPTFMPPRGYTWGPLPGCH